VPVGEDQHPHVELTRELARRFNTIYGETFPVPELLEGKAIRVPGLDGTGKMGKSDYNTIDLSDSPDNIRKKIVKAVTDPSRKRKTDPGDPLVCNIYALHTLISDIEELQKVLNGCKTAEIGCTECKEIIAKNIVNVLAPIQQKKSELISKGLNFALEILHEGGKRARKRIVATVEEVKEKMGVPMY
jgi:tryptophanyl-tRNA synthetase